jgi:ubiquinone/menaquinone biosynthesis C-methylase UbiE
MNFLKKKFNFINNIFTNSIDDLTTKNVVKFYNAKPFPNYDANDNKASILNKGEKNFLAKKFKQFVGYNKKVLEVGCGTGQLSIYFSIGTNNEIIALDPTLESLKLASRFSSEDSIKNIKFLNADIFDDVLTDSYFDFIWSNGVLHHTKDPKKAFEISIKSLKKEGYILVGLYNSIGRIRSKVRKYIYKIFGKKVIMFLDPVLRNIKSDSPDQVEAWIRDQYQHPVESTHTLDEVLEWFDENNIEFISSIPKCSIDLNASNSLFLRQKRSNLLYRLINQILMLFNYLGDDGGLFVVIGKKK